MIVGRSYRKGDWKLIVGRNWFTAESGRDLELEELYNLATDPSEEQNVLKSNPHVAESLFAEMKQFVDTREAKPWSAQTRGRKRPR